MSTKKLIQAKTRQLELPQSTQSEAVPPPSSSAVPKELTDIVARLIAYVVTHSSHEGEGDDLYNECIPILERLSR